MLQTAELSARKNAAKVFNHLANLSNVRRQNTTVRQKSKEGLVGVTTRLCDRSPDYFNTARSHPGANYTGTGRGRRKGCKLLIQVTMVKIKNVTLPTFDDNGCVLGAGCVSLSNSIDVWFSLIHENRTVEEATETANNICDALNQEEL